MIAPVTVVAHAAHACAAYTWSNPSAEGRFTIRRGNVTVRVACHRTESNQLVFDAIRAAVVLAEPIDDPNELVAAEQKTCARFRGAACEVDTL